LDRNDWPLRLVTLVAVVAWLGGGCGTVYQPRPSARVVLVIHHGAALYVKNGQEVPIGPLGGAIEPLIESSPQAVERAHRARRELAFGVPCYLAGAGSVIVGLTSSRWSPSLRWTLIGAGAVSGGTGLGLIGAGVTNIVDAVNIYNDSLSSLRPSP
jgi:hypothetical protein